MNDTFENVTSLRTRLDILQAEHRDLDQMIASLGIRPVDDELLVHRLKKRKLLIKDRISLIERLIAPDILA